MNDLKNSSPIEIDTELARLYKEEQVLGNRILHTRMRISTMSRDRNGYDHDTFEEDLDDVKYIATDLHDFNGTRAATILDRWTAAEEALIANLEEQAPYIAEYECRGRWNRAYLVLNPGGHVHSNLHCSTCYPTTDFGWLPQVSGFNEDEIVERAGQGACTVCYPSAPTDVLSRPRTLLHESEEKLAQVRAYREEKKAIKLAQIAANSIASADGGVLKVHYHAGTQGKVFTETLKSKRTAQSWLTDSQEGWGRSTVKSDINAVADALAVKNGTTRDEEIEAAHKRAMKRR